jgi:hypothetical protein
VLAVAAARMTDRTLVLVGGVVGGAFDGTMGALVFAGASAIPGAAWAASWLIPVAPARS